MKAVLTEKLKQQKLLVVDAFAFEKPKTRDFLGTLQTLQLENKVLVVDSRDNRNLYLSARNLSQVKMVPAAGVNIFDLLHYEHLVMSKNAILHLQEMLQR